MTYREIAYYLQDAIKAQSDDSSVTLEHIIFLIDKYRLFLIKQKYSKAKEIIPSGNTQTICLDLESYSDEVCGSETYLRSTKKIPDIIELCTPNVYLASSFSGNVTYVTPERFRFVGTNKYTKNIIYCTIDADNYLYVKSANPQFKYLEQIRVNGVFEDPIEAAKLSCDSNNNASECPDILDTTFYLEQGLVPQLIELVQKELLGVTYRPKDTINNSADDIADLVAYVRRNMKSNLAKQMTS